MTDQAKSVEEAMDEAMVRGADMLRALSLSDDAAGGYAVPKQLDTKGPRRKPGNIKILTES